MTTTTTTTTDDHAALGVIRKLASEGHAMRYIADALNLARVPTPSGKPGTRWHALSVSRVASKHGVRIGWAR